MKKWVIGLTMTILGTTAIANSNLIAQTQQLNKPTNNLKSNSNLKDDDSEIYFGLPILKNYQNIKFFKIGNKDTAYFEAGSNIFRLNLQTQTVSQISGQYNVSCFAVNSAGDLFFHNQLMGFQLIILMFILLILIHYQQL